MQDTFLRWQAADREHIETPEAWLTMVLTNVCLNQLAPARARRETCVRQWLPEPDAVGDAGIAEGAGGTPLQMSCASGIPMAWRATNAFEARLTGRRIPEKAIGYSVQRVSLGRRDGIIQFVTPMTRSKSSVVVGRTGARI